MVNLRDSSNSEDESSSIGAPNYNSLSYGTTATSPSSVSSDESDIETGAQTTINTNECEINIVSL